MFLFFIFIPFILFLWGLIFVRLKATDKEKKTGKIMIIVSIVSAIIGLGICGSML